MAKNKYVCSILVKGISVRFVVHGQRLWTSTCGILSTYITRRTYVAKDNLESSARTLSRIRTFFVTVCVRRETHYDRRIKCPLQGRFYELTQGGYNHLNSKGKKF